MKKINKGYHVSVHYTGTLDDGEVFDSSEGGAPLKFTVGKGSIIEGFESAVIGMEQDQEINCMIPVEKAYGERRENLIIKVDKEEFGPGDEPELGMKIGVRMDNGKSMVASVVKIGEKKVTLDLNHPLAGKSLNFKIRIMEIHEPGAPGTENWDEPEDHCCGDSDCGDCGHDSGCDHDHGSGCGHDHEHDDDGKIGTN